MAQPVLVGEREKVRWLGDRMSIVIAESEKIAQEACQLVRVEYEPLPVVTGPREATKPEASLIHEERGDSSVLNHIKVRKGEIEKGFAEADIVIESDYVTPHVEHAYMQPEAGVRLD